MSWRVRAAQGSGVFVNGGSLALALEFAWEGRGVVETAAAEYWVHCLGIRNFWPITRVVLGPVELRPDGQSEFTQYLPLPTDPGRIERIEAKRNGGNGLRLEVTCNVYSREVTHAVIRNEGRDATIRSLSAPGAYSAGTINVHVDRDSWIAMLKVLGWSETEVFELPAEPFREHEKLKTALAVLRTAEEAMRLGHWASAVTESRKAVEVAAGVERDMDTSARKKAFQTFLDDVFMAEGDGPRRSTASDLMQALAYLRNEGGAHGTLRLQLERADAELSFRTAMTLFRFIANSMRE